MTPAWFRGSLALSSRVRRFVAPRTSAPGWPALAFVAAVVATSLLAGGAALAQGADVSADAKAAAYDAERAARDARESADSVRESAIAAREAAEAATAAAAEATALLETLRSERAAPGAPAPADDAALARAEAAAEAARAAAAQAQQAAERAAEAATSPVDDLTRTGFYIGGGGYFAAEDLDVAADVDDSRGLYAVLGYRIHPNVSLDLRSEWLDAFDIENSRVEGHFKGGTVALNLRLGVPWRSLYPYALIGAGVMVGEVELRSLSSGRKSTVTEAEALFKVGAGLELALSRYVFLQLEAAYQTASGDLDGADYGVLGAGILYRF